MSQWHCPRLSLLGPRLLCSYSPGDPTGALLSSFDTPCSYCQTSFLGPRFSVAESLWFFKIFHLWCSNITSQAGASAEGPSTKGPLDFCTLTISAYSLFPYVPLGAVVVFGLESSHCSLGPAGRCAACEAKDHHPLLARGLGLQ